MNTDCACQRQEAYEADINTSEDEALLPEIASQPDENTEATNSWIKCRYIVAMIGFVVCFYFSASRMNVSVSIVAMVNNSVSFENPDFKLDSCPELLTNFTDNKTHLADRNLSGAKKFNWSPKIQGYILGCYYFIYIFMQIPYGKLVERYGCKWFLLGGTIMDALGTLVIPTASYFHPYVVITVQVLRGAAQGTYIASVTVLAANWFPQTERGRMFTTILSGFSIGTFTGSILSGFLCKSSLLGGWPSAFYTYGIAALFPSFVVAVFLHENPRIHPRISQDELTYITSNQENDLSLRRPNPPWRKIFRSVPVYALTAGYFGQNWAISQFLLVHSTFLGTILHYPIDQDGFFSAVPFLLMFAFTQISSWLSSVMTKRECASIDQIRKFWNFISCLGFSACLLGVYFAGCDRVWSIVFSILSVGFIGFGESGSLIVSTDMSPTFAASVNAVCNVLGIMPCFILPLVVGYLTDGMQTIEQWNKIFFITIGIVMTSAVIFSVFGSAKIQPWNHVDENTEDESKPS